MSLWNTLNYGYLWLLVWRREWQPTPVFLPGESHGQRSLAGHSPWGPEELDTTEWLILLLPWLPVIKKMNHLCWSWLLGKRECSLDTVGVTGDWELLLFVCFYLSSQQKEWVDSDSNSFLWEPFCFSGFLHPAKRKMLFSSLCIAVDGFLGDFLRKRRWKRQIGPFKRKA